jgi:hypothetical protein
MATFPERVAAAVAPIDGVTGHTVPPDVPLAGAVWSQWAGLPDPEQYGDGSVDLTLTQWDVVVVLPAGNDTATYEALATIIPAVVRAVSPLGTLGPIEPTGLLLAAGRLVPAVSISVVEAEGA